jgi:hypothetical protein
MGDNNSASSKASASNNGVGSSSATNPVNNATFERPATDMATDSVFSLSDFRQDQDFDFDTGVQRIWTSGSIKPQKPSKEWWVRTRPDWKVVVKCLELKDDKKELYLIHNSIADLVSDPTISKRCLFGAVNRGGKPFVWPIRYRTDGKELDSWSKVAYEAALRAEMEWVRLIAIETQGYKVEIATADLGLPQWPDLSWEQVVGIAFEGRILSDLKADVLQTLKGRL